MVTYHILNKQILHKAGRARFEFPFGQFIDVKIRFKIGELPIKYQRSFLFYFKIVFSMKLFSELQSS